MKIKATIGYFACIGKNGAGKLLLCQRTDNNLWNLPGGGAEDSDASGLKTPYDIVKREAQEETGLIVYFKVFRPIGVYATASHSDVAVTYHCGVKSGGLKESAEAKAFQWFSPAEIMSLAKNGELLGGFKTEDNRIARHLQMCLHFFSRASSSEGEYRGEAIWLCKNLGIAD